MVNENYQFLVEVEVKGKDVSARLLDIEERTLVEAKRDCGALLIPVEYEPQAKELIGVDSLRQRIDTLGFLAFLLDNMHAATQLEYRSRLGQLLAMYRKPYGQKYFAEVVGEKQSHINNIEMGRAKVTLRNILEIVARWEERNREDSKDA